jgi:hypothetical protein
MEGLRGALENYQSSLIVDERRVLSKKFDVDKEYVEEDCVTLL